MTTRTLIGRVETLGALAAEVAPEHAIVELGVNRGKTALALAKGSRGARVWAIDLWDMRLPSGPLDSHREGRGFTAKGQFLEFLTALDQSDVEDGITWVKGDTVQIAKVWTRPIGLLHIDAAHDYESVRKDFKAWSPSVVSGGWLCMDDAQPSNKVAAVINDIVLPSGEWTPRPGLVEGRLFVARRRA